MEPTINSGPVTTTAVGVRYGLLAGVASIIFSLLLFLTNMDQSPVRWLGLIITVGAMFLAHNQFKQRNGGYLNYGEGLGIGTIMSVVSGVISTVFTYFYIAFMDPDYVGRALAKQRLDLENKGNISDEQIDQAMAMAEKFSGGIWMLVFGILGSLLFGFLIALVVSAFTKNTRPEFE